MLNIDTFQKQIWDQKRKRFSTREGTSKGPFLMIKRLKFIFSRHTNPIRSCCWSWFLSVAHLLSDAHILSCVSLFLLSELRSYHSFPSSCPFLPFQFHLPLPNLRVILAQNNDLFLGRTVVELCKSANDWNKKAIKPLNPEHIWTVNIIPQHNVI